MSVTLGTYDTLPNPDEGQARCTEEAVAAEWPMADGSLARHVVTTRLTWDYQWTAGGTDYSNLVAAYNAAKITTKTFKAPEAATTWTVTVKGWSDETITANGGFYHRVRFTIMETTA